MRTVVCLQVLSMAALSQAFTNGYQQASVLSSSTTQLSERNDEQDGQMDRRNFGQAVWGLATSTAASGLLVGGSQPANAQVFFDPAMYGDQELRVGAVDSVKESVRRAILKKPQLAPSFYQLSLLDALSYDAKTQKFGPDSSVVKLVLSSKEEDSYTKNLQEACLALIDAERALRKKTAITLADAIAIGGAEAIESIGGPVLPVQLGRADAPLEAKVSALPIDLFKEGKYSNMDVTKAFLSAGMTEREMVALMAGMLTLETVEKTRSTEDWKRSSKPKFREAGKMGRMSEFRRLTDEDIAEAEAQAELEADPDYEDPDDGWYIADSFGTRDSRFGERLAKDDISEKTFNKYLKEIVELQRKKENIDQFGWIATLLTDPNIPTANSIVQKYGSSNLNYIKDLSASFNSITQLGAVYTGGKYESLLKNKPRKSLNNDDLNLF